MAGRGGSAQVGIGLKKLPLTFHLRLTKPTLIRIKYRRFQHEGDQTGHGSKAAFKLLTVLLVWGREEPPYDDLPSGKNGTSQGVVLVIYPLYRTIYSPP